MKIPYWLLKLLPMWDYICPKCRKEVEKNSHKCTHCSEYYGIPLRVPPKVLKDPKALEDYVHQHIFPKVSAQQRAYLTQFFTVLLSSGWENSEGTDITDGGAWTGTEVGTGETATVVTTDPHHGEYHARFTTDGSSTIEDVGCYIDWGAASSYTLLYGRAYVKYVSGLCPNNNDYQFSLQFLGVTALNVLARLGVEKLSGVLNWRLSYRSGDTLTSTYSATPTINTDQWYCLELYVKIGGVDGEYAAWVDDNLVFNLTDLDTDNNGNIRRFGVGQRTAINTVADTYFDCVVVADTGPIGTEEIVPCLVTTVDATGVTKDSATLNGHIATEGEVTVTERGFEWLKAGESEWISWTEEEEEGFEDGDYNHEITSLERGTLYYVKAKAYHEEEEEWVYGVEKYFTTKQYFIKGITKDANGNVLGECAVLLFKADNTYVDGILSDSETGEYEFEVDDDTTEYWLRAYKENETNVFGTTDIVTGETE